ncbi:unnamed protein product [Staurois parvus]|uniref:Uncharacterized protein n=1 Tax=Staurois parvus TaxID=386267 RepID=A0ABN9AWE7_9NEOB|nr:unnamed protein product [Staurois parvus]
MTPIHCIYHKANKAFAYGGIFHGGRTAPPRRKDRRRDTCGKGTRWDLTEAAGCLMVYAEPDSSSQGCPEL